MQICKHLPRVYIECQLPGGCVTHMSNRVNKQIAAGTMTFSLRMGRLHYSRTVLVSVSANYEMASPTARMIHFLWQITA